MKKILMALMFLIPPDVSAYTPVYGCFTENYALSCSQNIINCQTNSYTNALYFGYTVGVLCDNYAACVGSLAGSINDYNSLSTRFNANIKAYNKKVALENKLRKACGSKCKKIK